MIHFETAATCGEILRAGNVFQTYTSATCTEISGNIFGNKNFIRDGYRFIPVYALMLLLSLLL
jgi:hypothetical protein